MLSGRRTVFGVDQRTIVASRCFDLSRGIPAPGFSHAVETQSELLGELGYSIVTAMLNAIVQEAAPKGALTK